MRKILKLFISLILLGIFAWYIQSNWINFQAITLIRPHLLLVIAVSISLNIFCLGMLLDIAIEPHGVKLKSSEVLGLSAITRFGNFISTAYLGTALRALYLKKNYKISFAKFSSSFALSNILYLSCSGIVALIIFLYRGDMLESSMLPILLIATAMLFMILFTPVNPFVKFISLLRSKKELKILERLSEAIQQYERIRKHPGILLRMFFWISISLFLAGVNIYLAFLALGEGVSYFAALFMGIMSGWAIILSLTPGNIGVNEGFLVVGAKAMGVPLPTTIAVAILIRLANFTVTSIIALYTTPKLFGTSLLNVKDYNKNDS